jgi:hypothetical protein
MSSTSARPAGWSNTNPEHGVRSATGHFMLTLCRLPGPVSIRPPESPQLKPFTFFTSRECEPDGHEHLYLHMGYFETLADAEKWVEGVRGRFPNAIATIAPTAFLRPSNAEAPASQVVDAQPKVTVTQKSDLTATEDKSLSDTQVLKILETRGVVRGRDEVDERNCDQIALVRPEDTGTRHALKEAVVQGAPVSFAVQLQWSAQPIDLSRVPSLAIFKANTLYATECRRDGRSRYFLRLGFFGDPISAKQIAVQVRSNFASAAVVPVSDQEVTRAREASKDNSSIPSLVQQEVNRTVDSNSTPALPTASEPASDTGRRLSRDDRTLERALKRLARREMWTNPDLLSESGVRHVKVEVEVQRRTSRSSKGVGT